MTTVADSLAGAALTASSPHALRRFLYAVGTLVLLCLFCAPLYSNPVARDAPHARRGVVSLAGWRGWDRVVPLQGEWRLVWEAPSLPAGPRAGDAVTAPVPGRWDNLHTNAGARLPRAGLVSYQLTIHGLPPGEYTLFVPTIVHASTVSVNGRLVSAMGRLGTSAATTRPLWRPHDVRLHADGSDLQLTIRVAAFRQVINGLDAPPELGLTPVMSVHMSLEYAQQLLYIATLMILFFYGVSVFMFRMSDLASLYFGLSGFFLIPTIMVIGHDNLLWMLLPHLRYSSLMGIEFVSLLIYFIFILSYVNMLYPRERSWIAFWIFQGVFIGAVAVITVLLARGDTVLASEIDRYPVFFAVLELFYILVVILRATRRGRDGAGVFLLGLAVFTASMFQEIAVQYGLVPADRVPLFDYRAMGILVFLFSQIIILAERWSSTIRETETMASDLRRLMEVSASIASEIRLDALLKRVVEATSKFLHVERSTLFLHDGASDELWSMVAEGMQEREIRMPADSGIAGDSFRRGEASIVNAPYEDPRFNKVVDQASGYRTQGILTLPIVTRDGRRLGVMQALNREDGQPFTNADLDRMRAFAAHAAVAIDNATLFSEVAAARNYNESILASMSGGVLTLRADGRVETVNAAGAAILEVDAAAIRGAPVQAMLTGANAWLLAEFDGVRQAGQARGMLDVEFVTASRTISINLSIVPLVNEQVDAGLLVLFEDISQEKRLKGAMRRFMTQKVVDQVLDRQDELMFGSACVASVLFADIRGFTSLAEKLAPRATVDMLNEVFTDLVDAVNAHDGVVDKFIGDAVMAVFGAPISSGRDPRNAADAADGMMRMVAALNVRRAERGEPVLRLGVGVATGELIAGTIGSPKRMDYTVIGDSVNLASRVQDLTKGYGVGVMLCEATAMAVAGDHVLRRLDTVAVRGRDRPERLYQLLTYHTEETFPHRDEVIAAYEAGLAGLEAHDYAAAARFLGLALSLYPDDRPSQIMLERVRAAMMGAIPK
jgi:adenylate cyclase